MNEYCKILALRGEILKGIRDFFYRRDFVEVETPILAKYPNLEPYIDYFCVCSANAQKAKLKGNDKFFCQPDFYLPSSPEYYMKRLLARGMKRIFQICKSFRDEPSASLHLPEFTILEWYRAEADYFDIMRDTEELILHLTQQIKGEWSFFYQDKKFYLSIPFKKISVAEAMRQFAAVDIIEASTPEKLAYEASKLGIFGANPNESWDTIFFRIFLELVEPKLGISEPIFLYDYPASMASLARLKKSEPPVAERFEFYLCGLELANGFSELNDPVEQRRRFLQTQKIREDMSLPVPELDEEFLRELKDVPPSGGIALGVDRLVMIFADVKDISKVVAFPF